jgi:MerR, DNA binding
LIATTSQPQDSCHAADSIARRNLQAIELKIAALESLRNELSRMVDTCSKGRVAECRVLQVLADHDQCSAQDHVRL